ncbi:hypothetical protein V1508DRAFT_405560 [Lipomyces doorenjongii]|uniref:uncharacterized protein n=1 Tax=Lipomyces doorenjongii TaxID=383834 RepID=UPI0034CFB14A
MIKTGATVLWQRFPIHVATTLPQVLHLAVYSDAPDMVAGIPIIDILAGAKQKKRDSGQFNTWRTQQQLLSEHATLKWWQLDKYKNLPMVAHGQVVHLYILWPIMMRWLSSINHEDMLYMGSVTYQSLTAPFVHGGSGVIMSGALVRETFGKDPSLGGQYEEYAQYHCCGDHVLAHAFQDRGGFEGELQAEPPSNVRYSKDNWCKEIVTFHHLTAHDIEKLYELPDFKDAYHEFIMPYLRDDRRNNWDNLADIREYSNDLEEDLKNPQVTAYNSYENCSDTCQEWEDCVQFRYRPGHCGLSNETRLGQKHMDGDKSFSSSWRLDRIQEVRKRSGCDPVDAAQDEGSFVRQQNEEAKRNK